jgi:hypothetical protein
MGRLEDHRRVRNCWRLASKPFGGSQSTAVTLRVQLEQLYVYKIVERNVSLCIEFLDKLPPDVCLDGVPRQCRASTRKGTPCQRDPLPRMDYCPSHKHLEEPATEEFQPIAA